MDVQCIECSKVFSAKRPHQHFCQASCRQAFHNLSAKRGVMLMPLLLAWRGGKHGKNREEASFAFKELCVLADAWNAEDKAAGRKSVQVVTDKMAMSWRAVDALG